MYDMSGLLGKLAYREFQFYLVLLIHKFEEVDEIPEETGTSYNEEVNSMIRQRYSLSEELAILRQRDSKPDEFEAYNEYAEYCKVEVKRRMIEERSSPGDGDEQPNT